MVAAVAAGAFVAAGQAMNNTASAGPAHAPALAGMDTTTAMGVGGDAPLPEYLPVIRSAALAVTQDVQAMAKSQRLDAKRAAEEAEANRPKYVLPTHGVFTSGFGGRWGAFHWGIDLANSIGTPIVAAADGVVVESGPASGFGLWVRLRHADGTITVYGHINRSLVHEGEKVQAGEEIAEMGNRGDSTGPHLHFEVWDPSGHKINPLIWLREHGVDI
ncbi:MAG: M23 family metallopeptidase [Pseudonocardiaceae bacterium]